MQEELKQKTPVSRLIIIIVTAILLMILGIIIGYYMSQGNVSNQVNSEGTGNIQSNQASSKSGTSQNQFIDETVNWNIYSSQKIGLNFKYPKEWFIEENNDKTGVSINPTDAKIAKDEGSIDMPKGIADLVNKSCYINVSLVEGSNGSPEQSANAHGGGKSEKITISGREAFKVIIKFGFDTEIPNADAIYIYTTNNNSEEILINIISSKMYTYSVFFENILNTISFK